MNLECPCGKAYEVGKGLTGRRLRCACGRVLTVGSDHVYEPPPSRATHDRADNDGGRSRAGAAPATPKSGIIAVLGGITAFVLLIALGASNSRSTSTSVNRPPGAPTSASASGPAVDPQRRAAPAGASCSVRDVIRPRSSQELARFSVTGYGRLTIDNGTRSDAVAVLVRAYDGRPYRAIYIRDGERGIFTRIAECRYRLQFQFGRDWLRQRKFCERHGTNRFEEVFDFEVQRAGDRVLSTEFEVTLHEVAGGNARTRRLPASQFELPPL